MKLKFALLFVLLMSKAGFSQEKPKFSSQSVKEDLDYLYQSLQSTHYNLFAFQSQRNMIVCIIK